MPAAAGRAPRLAEGGEQGDAVAEALAEAAGLEEVARPVDDDQVRRDRIERQGRRLGTEKGPLDGQPLGGNGQARSALAGPGAGSSGPPR